MLRFDNLDFPVYDRDPATERAIRKSLNNMKAARDGKVMKHQTQLFKCSKCHGFFADIIRHTVRRGYVPYCKACYARRRTYRKL